MQRSFINKEIKEQKHPPEVSCKIVALKFFVKFIDKHLRWSLFVGHFFINVRNDYAPFLHALNALKTRGFPYFKGVLEEDIGAKWLNINIRSFSKMNYVFKKQMLEFLTRTRLER